MDNNADQNKVLQRRKKIYGIISIVVLLALAGWLTYFIFVQFKQFGGTPEQFRDFIQSFGWGGRFIGLGIQILQVIIALIPGEAVEIGMGYAFGALEGTIICLVGVLIASTLVFLLVKFFGIKLVEIFVSREKINSLKFLNNEKGLKKLIFILFFIPGTPKDLLTYFAGLTNIKLLDFLVISTIARIPSVVSSTIGGHYIAEKDYIAAVIIFVITAVVSLIGLKIYNVIIEKKETKGEQTPAK